MTPMASRRHRAAVAGLTRVRLPEGVLLAAALGDPRRGARKIVDDPVHVSVAPGLAERRIGIMADDGERLGAVGRLRPFDGGRDVVSLAGVLGGDGLVGAEARRTDLHG